MKKLIAKSILYGSLLILALEILVRVFFLGKDNPTRYLDEYNVEKWKPNQHGYSVTGNRRQNFSEFRINNSGFNSYREFTPTQDSIEIAIVGDSFIEGFHQDYYSSIGKKIENKLPEVAVYEYGYAGYDMADQLHLIHQYKKQFDLIDHVIIYIRFSDDLRRDKYEVIQDRLALESPLNKLFKKSKLLVYSKNIGIFDPIRKLPSRIINFLNRKKVKKAVHKSPNAEAKKYKRYIENFEHLVEAYGYDKNRFVLLLDTKTTSSLFISYLDKNQYNYIDFSKAFEISKSPTTLIYDQHWNNHGRDLIATLITGYIRTK